MQPAVPILWNPNLRQFEVQRTPTWVESVSISSNSWFVLHTPASGLKHRLLAYSVSVPSNYTNTAGISLFVSDGQNAGSWSFSAIDVGPSGSPAYLFAQLPGNGILGRLADRPLYAKIATAPTAGYIQLSAWGCDE